MLRCSGILHVHCGQRGEVLVFGLLNGTRSGNKQHLLFRVRTSGKTNRASAVCTEHYDDCVLKLWHRTTHNCRPRVRICHTTIRMRIGVKHLVIEDFRIGGRIDIARQTRLIDARVGLVAVELVIAPSGKTRSLYTCLKRGRLRGSNGANRCCAVRGENCDGGNPACASNTDRTLAVFLCRHRNRKRHTRRYCDIREITSCAKIIRTSSIEVQHTSASNRPINRTIKRECAIVHDCAIESTVYDDLTIVEQLVRRPCLVGGYCHHSVVCRRASSGNIDAGRVRPSIMIEEIIIRCFQCGTLVGIAKHD